MMLRYLYVFYIEFRFIIMMCILATIAYWASSPWPVALNVILFAFLFGYIYARAELFFTELVLRERIRDALGGDLYDELGEAVETAVDTHEEEEDLEETICKLARKGGGISTEVICSELMNKDQYLTEADIQRTVWRLIDHKVLAVSEDRILTEIKSDE